MSVETSGALAMFFPHAPIPPLSIALSVSMAFFLLCLLGRRFLSYSCILSVSIGIRDRLWLLYILSSLCPQIFFIIVTVRAIAYILNYQFLRSSNANTAPVVGPGNK